MAGLVDVDTVRVLNCRTVLCIANSGHSVGGACWYDDPAADCDGRSESVSGHSLRVLATGKILSTNSASSMVNSQERDFINGCMYTAI